MARSTSYEAPHYSVSSKSPVTSSLFGPNILLSTLFSNTLSLWSPLNVRDQISHPYRTTGKIIVLYILTAPHETKKNRNEHELENYAAKQIKNYDHSNSMI
jgi:hypothetical protein